ncbi:hypothetical protein O1L60_36905 [Streptomyces diastatochromogenes]|nr:hypothetical protein [Streptomyces diastatochromogenes]
MTSTGTESTAAAGVPRRSFAATEKSMPVLAARGFPGWASSSCSSP